MLTPLIGYNPFAIRRDINNIAFFSFRIFPLLPQWKPFSKFLV